MLPHPARLAHLQATAWIILPILAILPGVDTARAAPSQGPAQVPALERTAADDEAALAAAQDRIARADAAVDDLKHALSAGHLIDPLPDADRTFGLETLRTQYDNMQRRAAGYRATLGDQHPTLVAAEAVLDDLRAQLLGGTRRALAATQRNAADARVAVATIERRLATRAAGAAAQARAASEQSRAASEQSRGGDVTGSIAPALVRRPHVAAVPTALPAAAEPDRPAAAVAAVAAAPAARTTSPGTAAGALAILLALALAWAAPRIGRAFRRLPHSPKSSRVEPALGDITPAPAPAAAADDTPAAARPAAPGAIPVLATLPLPGPEAMAEIADAFGRQPQGTLAAAAADLHAVLRTSLDRGTDARMTVLVAGVEGSPDGNGAALALALAAAAAGRRVALLEARLLGNLRGAVVPAGAVPMLIAAGGTERTLYRLDTGPLTVAVLPSDTGEAEEAAAAARRAGTVRLPGLDAFDTVILVGEATGALARAADLVLIVVPAAAAPAAVAAAAAPCHEAGRLCGALAIASVVPVATPRPARARRRIASDPAHLATGRLGLRGSLEPLRRRVG